MDVVWDVHWMDPGMRQVVGFGDQFMGGVILGVNVGCPVVTNGELAAQRCKSA